MLSFPEHTIILTGGASGLGRVMAIALARRDASLVVADVSAGALQALERELQGQGLSTRKVRLVEVDMARPDAADRLVEHALAGFSKVTALINNAGIGRAIMRPDFLEQPPKLWELDDRNWQQFLAVNATAVLRTMRAVIPHFLAQGYGRIVNVTTSLDSMMVAGATGYGASKAAAEAFSAIAAHDLRGTGVTVNVLIPGGLADTGMVPAGTTIARSAMLSPDVMIPPLLWLLSAASPDVTARRFRANLWDAAVEPDVAAATSGAPIAWGALAGQLRLPEGSALPSTTPSR